MTYTQSFCDYSYGFSYLTFTNLRVLKKQTSEMECNDDNTHNKMA